MDGPVIGLQIEGLAAFGRMHKLKKAPATVAGRLGQFSKSGSLLGVLFMSVP